MPTPIKFCCASFASVLIAASVSFATAPVEIAVHLDEPIADLRPIWNYFGYDEAGTTLTPEGRHLLTSGDEARVPLKILPADGFAPLAIFMSKTKRVGGIRITLP